MEPYLPSISLINYQSVILMGHRVTMAFEYLLLAYHTFRLLEKCRTWEVEWTLPSRKSVNQGELVPPLCSLYNFPGWSYLCHL